ncbi:MAG: hypothetical protein J5680_06185 [Neisseriaceae bacterium]|nr:hypothetical protein [Neisseriaceae bacterium]
MKTPLSLLNGKIILCNATKQCKFSGSPNAIFHQLGHFMQHILRIFIKRSRIQQVFCQIIVCQKVSRRHLQDFGNFGERSPVGLMNTVLASLRSQKLRLDDFVISFYKLRL